MHDNIRNPARVADAREERDVALAAALQHDDALLVGLHAERLEDEREDELLGAAFDEQRGSREEELGAVAVELGQDPECLGLCERRRLKQRGPSLRVVTYESELLHPVDAQEDRCMG